MSRQVLFVAVFVLIVTLFSTFIVDAQGPRPGTRAPKALAGTAFTYQGQLKNGGALVNGNCDFGFRLYDAASSGTQIGSVISTTVPITNGLFTVQLDFGANAINGDARWLDILVRCGGGVFTPLTTRQALSPAPMALALPGMYTYQNGTSPNVIGGFSGNVISNTVVGGTIGGGGTAGFENKVWADYATVSGGINNAATKLYAAVGGGYFNTASNSYATIGGGWSNQASGNVSTIGGGYDNRASNIQSTIGGGTSNIASGFLATIGGGELNTASSDYATIGGGGSNSASGGSSPSGGSATVGGGSYNTASGGFATIGGGKLNRANNAYVTVGGGYNNTASGVQATVGGGDGNTANGIGATVGGGGANRTIGDYAIVSGGQANTASGQSATVGGGDHNNASYDVATIAGGQSNTASGYRSTIGGGQNNRASSGNSFIGGGYQNTVGSEYATIGGGRENLITGTAPIASYAVIPGGYQASARDYGQLAFASGGFSSVPGTAQHSVRVLRNTTATDGAWVELFADSSSQRITIPPHSAMSFNIQVVGLTADDWVGSWEFRGVIKNTGGTLSQGCPNAICIPTTPLKTVLQGMVAGEDALVEAEIGNAALSVKVKGNIYQSMRWVATVQLTEVKW